MMTILAEIVLVMMIGDAKPRSSRTLSRDLTNTNLMINRSRTTDARKNGEIPEESEYILIYKRGSKDFNILLSVRLCGNPPLHPTREVRPDSEERRTVTKLSP